MADQELVVGRDQQDGEGSFVPFRPNPVAQRVGQAKRLGDAEAIAVRESRRRLRMQAGNEGQQAKQHDGRSSHGSKPPRKAKVVGMDERAQIYLTFSTPTRVIWSRGTTAGSSRYW